MRNTTKPQLLAIIIILTLTIGCQQSPELGSNYPIGKQLTKGAHSVGFQFFTIPDYSRSIMPANEECRSVSFGVWYPAKRSSNEKLMTYADYFRATVPDPADSILQRYINENSFLGEADPFVLESNLEIISNSIWGAPPIDHSSPLVIYAGKANDVVFGNSVLFEILASHGYTVLSVPPIPPSQKGESMTLNNYNDICFAINQVKQSFPQCDVTEIATIGYEIGGISTTSFAISNAHVKGHISLNGAIGSWFGWQFSDHLYHNKLRDLKAPVLHFGTSSYEKSPENVMGESFFETADSINNADRYFYYLPNTVPLGVSSHLILSWVLPLSKVKEEYRINKDGIMKDYQAAVNTTLVFLDVYLKESKESIALEEAIRQGNNENFIKSKMN